MRRLVGALASIVSVATSIQFRSQDKDGADTDLCWIHIPKTGGTALRQALVKYPMYVPPQGGFCVGAPGVSEHLPLPVDVGDVDLAHVITMVRLPDQRLASTFTFVRSEMEHGGMPNFGWPMEANASVNVDAVKELLGAGQTPASNDILGSSFLGCQTNMMLGRQCMSGTPEDADIDKAKARIDAAFWVGLEEEWRLSMCLLNFKMTGERFVETYQDAVWNSVQGSGSSQAYSASHYDTAGYPPDAMDTALYEHAQERFKRELQTNDINPSTCSHTSDGTALEDTQE